jgi:hypothetical protein
MDEKRVGRRPIQLSLTLLLLLVALLASLLAVWRLQEVPDYRQLNYHLVEPGMTHHEVARILGERHSGKAGKWVYRIDRDEMNKEWITVEIAFENGVVKEVVTGRDPYPLYDRPAPRQRSG